MTRGRFQVISRTADPSSFEARHHGQVPGRGPSRLFAGTSRGRPGPEPRSHLIRNNRHLGQGQGIPPTGSSGRGDGLLHHDSITCFVVGVQVRGALQVRRSALMLPVRPHAEEGAKRPSRSMRATLTGAPLAISSTTLSRRISCARCSAGLSTASSADGGARSCANRRSGPPSGTAGPTIML